MTRYPQLDGLRGIAAFIVVLSHCAFAFWPALHGHQREVATHWQSVIANSPLIVAYNGTFAVYLFFVISGFVLSISFFKSQDNGIIRSMFARRYLRLMIPVFVTTLIAWCMWSLNLFSAYQATELKWFSSRYAGEPTLYKAIYDGLFGTIFQGANSYDFVLWTMRIEFFGSLLVFVNCLLLKGLRYRPAIYAFESICLLMILGTPAISYVCFIMGMYLAEPNNRKDWNPMVATAVIVGSLYMGGYKGFSTAHEPLKYLSLSIGDLKITATAFCYSVGAFVLVAAALHSRWLSSFLKTSPSQFLGKVSFSLYLLHPLILCSLGAFVYLKTAPATGPLWAAILASIATTITSLIASHYYTIVDITAISASRWFGNLLIKNQQHTNTGRSLDNQAVGSYTVGRNASGTD